MKKLVLVTRGTAVGGDTETAFESKNHSAIHTDSLGVPRAASPWGFNTTFPLLPAASVAAGSEKMLVSLGTSTEVIARAATGGINVKTQASTPADNDNAMLIAIATTDSVVLITAVSRIRFATRVNLTQITKLVFGAGMDENLTSPVGSATAGEGFQFYFDPAGEVSTGLAAAALPNWILAQKVNGTDTYVDSGVPVLAGRDYELVIEVGADLIPLYYINGVYVGVGASALTSGDSVGVVVGVQANGTPDAQSDFNCRYIAVERLIG